METFGVSSPRTLGLGSQELSEDLHNTWQEVRPRRGTCWLRTISCWSLEYRFAITSFFILACISFQLCTLAAPFAASPSYDCEEFLERSGVAPRV